MKKTDTCYYMSITKEENSAFVVANNQSGVGEGTQVIVETKTDASNGASAAAMNTAATAAGATSATTTTTTTTTISTSCTGGGGGDGNGTAISNGADAHQRFSNSCNVALSETLRRQETCTGPRAQERPNVGQPQGHRAPLPPQVILQVFPSTPTPIQHHNLLASDIHRECRMRLAAFSFLSSLSFLFFYDVTSISLSLSLLSIQHVIISLSQIAHSRNLGTPSLDSESLGRSI